MKNTTYYILILLIVVLNCFNVKGNLGETVTNPNQTQWIDVFEENLYDPGDTIYFASHGAVSAGLINDHPGKDVDILDNSGFLYLAVMVFGIFVFVITLFIKRNKEKKEYITKLKKSLLEKEETTKALKYSEGKYYSLIRTLNEGFIYTDNNDNILFLNEKACLIFGGIFDDLVNRSVYEFLLGPDDARIYRENTEFRDKGIAKQYELQIKKVDGEHRWVSLSMSPLLDEKNTWIGSVGIISDITERKKYDESMKELTANLNQKIKQLNCLYDISDITSIPGITFKEIFLRSLDIIPFGLKYTHDTCVEIVFENQVFHSKKFKDTEWSYTVPIKVKKKKLGHIRVCYIEEKPFINKDPFHFNEKILIKNIAEKLGQIIESKNMENALKEYEYKLSIAQKIAKLGNWEWDIINNRKVYSESLFDVLDIPGEKRIFFDEDMFMKMLHPDDKGKLQKLFDKISNYDFHDIKDIQFRFVQLDGNIKYIIQAANLVYNDQDEVVRLLFTIQDVTTPEGRDVNYKSVISGRK